jgi:hypothetical protein
MIEKISFIVLAGSIPDGTRVYKLTGSKSYVLKHTLKIYGEKEQVVYNEGVLYLVSNEHIIGIPENTKLRIDFDTVEEAVEWLQMNRV